jgi:uncharacterized protein (DUF4415 family)
MIKTIVLKQSDKPTSKQLKRIEQAVKLPAVNDKDSPIYTTKQLTYLYQESKKLNKKITVGIRLSQRTIEQYKDFGKGYTGIMAAVLDYAIKNPNLLRKVL